jgi:hypothetical protein
MARNGYAHCAKQLQMPLTAPRLWALLQTKP